MVLHPKAKETTANCCNEILAKMQRMQNLLHDPHSLFKGIFMARSSSCFTLLAAALVASTLTGCAKWEDRARYYLASTVDVFALVGGQLMQGKAHVYNDRTGTLAINTGLSVTPAVSCSGRISRTGTTAANIDMHCNDGTEPSLSAVFLADTQAYAYGPAANGMQASLTLGLEPARAVSYLRAPAGQQLVTLPKKPFMELR